MGGIEDVFTRKKIGAIALINPQSPFLLEERVFAPLCLADIGAVLEDKGYSVELLDLAVDMANPKDWRDETMRCARRNYNAFGITATSPQFMHAAEINRLIRKMKPAAHIVIGGAHPSMVSTLRKTKIAEWTRTDSSLKNDSDKLNAMLYEFDPNFKPLEEFDFIYDGDGESAVNYSMDPAFVRDHIEKTGSKWYTAPLVPKLDDLGLPARHLFQMETYKYSISVDGRSTRAFNVMTQRGCPFGCEFCSGRDSQMYKQVRTRGTAHVIRELKHMQEVHGAESFMFFDDEFNLNRARTIDLCQGMIELREQGVRYAWRAFIKSELFVKFPEIATYMKNAGCVEVCTGVESGSAFILKHVIHKNTSPELNLRAREIAKEAGLRYKAFTMVGHAGETEEDAMDTLAWILEAKPDDFDVTVCTPYPGAPYYDRAVRDSGDVFVYNDSLDKSRDPKASNAPRNSPKIDPKTNKERLVKLFFEKPDYSTGQFFYKGVPGEYKSLVWTPGLSADKLVQLREYIDSTAREKFGMTMFSRPAGYDQSMGAPPARVFSKSAS